jgi:hypothetical protein
VGLALVAAAERVYRCSQTMRRDLSWALLILGALAGTTACDPHWKYRARDGAVQRPAEFDQGISLRAAGELAIATLRVEVELRNDDAQPLTVGSAAFRVLDAANRPLTPSPGSRDRPPCADRKESSVTLGRGDACKISRTFEVVPMVQSRMNPDLRNLTVVVDGLARGGRPVSRSTVLERE